MPYLAVRTVLFFCELHLALLKVCHFWLIVIYLVESDVCHIWLSVSCAVFGSFV